jgi:hypothetical protein
MAAFLFESSGQWSVVSKSPLLLLTTDHRLPLITGR